MLHNEARKLLVEGYEATHNAKGIAIHLFSIYLPNKFPRNAENNCEPIKPGIRQKTKMNGVG